MSDNDLQQGVHTPAEAHTMAMTSHNLGGPHIQTPMIITVSKKACLLYTSPSPRD